MNKKGPIVVIEDDSDDQVLIEQAFAEIGEPNQLIFFFDGHAAYDYLLSTSDRPFLILSDINLPKLSGFQLREMVHSNELLRLKCIPYLFFSTSAEQKHVIDAYSKSVQGFFTKPHSFPEMVRILRNIVEYWKDCHSPQVIV